MATPETEEHWLEEARVLSNRGLESAVARAKGEAPKVRVTLELTPQDAADLDEAIRRLREERGAAVPIGEAVAELARRATGPPVDKPGYQIVIHECPTCGGVSRDTARDGPIEVAPEEVAAAREDAEIVDLRAGGTGAIRKSITPAERVDRFASLRAGRLPILVIEYAAPEDRALRDTAIASCRARGFLPYVAPIELDRVRRDVLEVTGR